MSYHKIIFTIVSLGTVLGGIFVPITTFSQASDIAANTTANQKSSSGGGSPLPNTASSPAGLDKFGIKGNLSDQARWKRVVYQYEQPKE